MSVDFKRMLAVAMGLAALGIVDDMARADARSEGTIHVPAFELPLSGYLSEETRAVLRRQAQERQAFAIKCPKTFADVTSDEEAIALRRCWDEHAYAPRIARHRARYKVDIVPKMIAGVPVEVFTPVAGIAPKNRERVLIDLHGGSFIFGGRWFGQIESIPIAAVGRIKVISVDYRKAPEHRFPAASEDVAAVYKALLRDHKPESIGIYGCSAGGLLTAQAVAWLHKEGLPTPGAVGMLCMGASWHQESDSSNLAAAIGGMPAAAAGSIAYLRKEDYRDPLAVPGLDPRVMARFPSSLLVTSTRDMSMSSVLVTHRQLVKLGVEADLHVWEGLGHGFFYEPDLPESREVYEVVASFFDAHLAR